MIHPSELGLISGRYIETVVVRTPQECVKRPHRAFTAGDERALDRYLLLVLTREGDQLSIDPKRRKTMDLYMKEREGKPNADCQSRSPMPRASRLDGGAPPPATLHPC